MAVYFYFENRIIKDKRLISRLSSDGKGQWQYNFQINKARYKGRCQGCLTRRQALEYEAEMRRRVVFGTYGKPDESTTFETYARGPFMRWSKAHKKTSRLDELTIGVICEDFGNKPLNEITKADIERYLLKRREGITNRKGTRSGASVNRERALLAKIFSNAIEDGYLEKNPVTGTKRFKSYSRRERILTHDEEQPLLDDIAKVDPWLLPIVRVALGTAMRRGELLKLRFNHLDFNEDLIHLPAEITKAGKARTIPMNADVRAVLLEQHGTGKVFKAREDRVSRRFAAACTRLGFDDMVFHSLRHTAISRMGENGMTPFVIQMIAGHASLTQTTHYSHVSLSELRKAVKTLENGEESTANVPAKNEGELNVIDKSIPDGNLQTFAQNA